MGHREGSTETPCNSVCLRHGLEHGPAEAGRGKWRIPRGIFWVNATEVCIGTVIVVMGSATTASQSSSRHAAGHILVVLVQAAMEGRTVMKMEATW